MWTFNSVRIYVQKFESGDKQIIARLQPINNGTTLHLFGYESQILNVSALVPTDANRDALRNLVTTGTSYTLSGPEGTVGDFYVSNIKASRTDSINTRLFDQPSLDCEVPIYMVEMELYIDN